MTRSAFPSHIADAMLRKVSFVSRFSLAAIGLSLSLFFAGCTTAKNDTSSRDGTKKLRIAVIPKGTSHQFWKSVHAGAEAAAKELGDVEILWKGPETEADTAGQISVVKNFITSHVDGIILAPNHSQALVDVVMEANAEKIPVAVFDSGLGAGPSLVSYVATDNFRGGQLAAKALAEAMGNEGKVIMLRYKEGSESTEQREKGFLDAMAKESKIQILSSDQYAGTSTEEALSAATSLLNKYRDQVTGIFAVCEPNCNGTLEALVQTGLAGKVKFVAFDSSESLIKGLSDKSVHGIVLQDPFAMGKESVLAIAKHLSGKSVQTTINTGEYVATPTNEGTDPINRLLRPEMF
jgi:ribose transport system substrate-binding protein